VFRREARHQAEKTDDAAAMHILPGLQAFLHATPRGVKNAFRNLVSFMASALAVYAAMKMHILSTFLDVLWLILLDIINVTVCSTTVLEEVRCRSCSFNSTSRANTDDVRLHSV